LPKIAPTRETPLGADENPFTLPAARGGASSPANPPPPAKPDGKTPPAPDKPKAEPKAEPPAPKEGLGARLMRSLRREPSEDAAKSAAPVPESAPVEPAEKKGFSLPSARMIEPDPAVPPPDLEPEPAPVVASIPPAVGALPPLLEPAAAPVAEPEPEVEIIDEPPAPKPMARPPVAAAPDAPAAKTPPAALPPAPIPDLDALSDPLAGADALPPYQPPPAAPPHPAAAPASGAPAPAPAPTAAQPAPGARTSPVYIAAIAGAALGTVSVLAVYLLLRNDNSTANRPVTEAPFARGTGSPMGVAAPAVGAAVPAPASGVPAPTVTPAPSVVSPAPVIGNPDAPLPKTIGAPTTEGGPISVPSPVAAPKASPEAEAGRPAATFTVAPRVVVAGQEPPKPKPKPKALPEDSDEPDDAAAPADKPRARASTPAAARRPKGPSWAFEGVVFDLLTARGVFAAKLIFLDPDGNQAGTVETGPGGRYKVLLPVLAGGGYSMKISHQDYTERYIDEGDATSSLREATPEERKILMSAASRNLPWVGNLKKTMHRDLALVPRSPEEP
jgi:Meckel syndrome type 1 protein